MDIESNLKMAAKQQALDQRNYAVSGLQACGEAGRPPLRERIARQKHTAQQESRRFERLSELDYLLEKNPEVARILDLMDSVKD